MTNEKYKIKYTITSSLDDKNINEIDSSEISLLYTNDLYDGPLEGVCEWRGEKFYFYVKDLKPRTYYLIKLTPEQLENDEKLHSAYQKYVESYPYIAEGSVSHRKDAEWDKYHRECEKYSDQEILQEQVVGWFKIES